MFCVDATYNGGSKISFICEIPGIIAGLCVYCNPNMKNQVQVYPNINRKHYIASTLDNYVCGEIATFKTDVFNNFWNKLDENRKNMIYNCTHDIGRAFYKFKNNVSLPSDKITEISNEITAFLGVIYDLKANKTDVPIAEEKEEWHFVDIDTFSKEDLTAITKLLSVNHEKAEYKGVFYRLRNDNGNFSFERLGKAGGDTTFSDSVITPQKVRKFMKMALMKNAENLSGFVNGNFYPIINEVNYNGKIFAVIQDDNGIAHNINENRFEKVNVYTEPPLA